MTTPLTAAPTAPPTSSVTSSPTSSPTSSVTSSVTSSLTARPTSSLTLPPTSALTSQLTSRLTVGFDLDLTLIDSQERVISAYIRALGDLGVEVSREELTPHLGMPLADTAAAVGAVVDADALVLRYRHYYDEAGAPRTLPMPGATEALRCVRAAGGRTVVVSAKFTAAVHTALAEARLTDLVDVVYGELFAQDKAAALIAEGASIYVGDHPGDMAAASAADAYAVGVTTGANDEAALLAAGADLTVADLDVFVDWLPRHVLGRSAQQVT